MKGQGDAVDAVIARAELLLGSNRGGRKLKINEQNLQLLGEFAHTHPIVRVRLKAH